MAQDSGGDGWLVGLELRAEGWAGPKDGVGAAALGPKPLEINHLGSRGRTEPGVRGKRSPRKGSQRGRRKSRRGE